jgi:energy-coupling factor transport system substrate-specific component
MFGSLMFASRVAMQGIPGFHLLGLFISAFTLTYRKRALIPLYVYVMLEGVYSGFAKWWILYLYVWLPVWVMFMLAGSVRLARGVRTFTYMFLCALHGLSFGLLCAPVDVWLLGLSFKALPAYVAAGFFAFDVPHAVGNFFMGTMIIPLSELLKKLDRRYY